MNNHDCQAIIIVAAFLFVMILASKAIPADSTLDPGPDHHDDSGDCGD